jgi:hypothetical protein
MPLSWVLFGFNVICKFKRGRRFLREVYHRNVETIRELENELTWDDLPSLLHLNTEKSRQLRISRIAVQLIEGVFSRNKIKINYEETC